MRAVLYHEFGVTPELTTVPDPTPEEDGAVIRVQATGVCRSDWHAWKGHDTDIQTLPHVPGHELAGEVVAVGRQVDSAFLGQRVTMPFVAGCGQCGTCQRGDQQVCPQQFQPGFSAWGSFAELVAVRYANENLVPLPNTIPSVTAAGLGCRLSTAYRAVVEQAGVQPGEWLAVFGCGGVGLSAVMVASAMDVRTIAIDVRPEPLAAAADLGAEITLNASEIAEPSAAIHDLTHGGADASIDALGSKSTLAQSILSLRRRGRQVQVGLLAGEDLDPPVPMGRVVGWELELRGSHGLAAHAFPGLLGWVAEGKIAPSRLVDRKISLSEAPSALVGMDRYTGSGMTVIDFDISE